MRTPHSLVYAATLTFTGCFSGAANVPERSDAGATESVAGPTNGSALPVNVGGSSTPSDLSAPSGPQASSAPTGTSGTNATMVAVLSVQPLFAINGARWTDYVVGGDAASARDEACNPATAPSRLACVHGGEMRRAIVPGQTSCEGLSATDSLGAFEWTCARLGTDTDVSVLSRRLLSGKGLTDLIDFAGVAPTFQPLQLTVTRGSTVLGQSAPSRAWWTNVIVDVQTDTSVLAPAPGQILVRRSSTPIETEITIAAASHLSIVTQPGITLSCASTCTRGNALLGLGTGTDESAFLWVEGAYDGGRGSAEQIVNIALQNVAFAQLGPLRLTGGGTNLELNRVAHAIVHDVVALFSRQAGISGYFVTGTWLMDITQAYANAYGVLGSATNARNHYRGMRVFGNVNNGVVFQDANSSATMIIAASNQGSGIGIESDSFILTDATAVANEGYGVSVRTPTSSYVRGIELARVAAIDNHSGGFFFDAPSSHAWDIASAGNGAAALRFGPRAFVRFSGALSLDRGPTDACVLDSGTAERGIQAGSCASSWESGALLHDLDHRATLTVLSDLSTTFVEKPTSDTANTSVFSAPGQATYNSQPDFGRYENPFRFFGSGAASSSLDVGARGMCTTNMTCQIWDVSLSASDSALRNRAGTLGVGDTRTLPWLAANTGECSKIPGAQWDLAYGYCFSRFAVNATEIAGDSVGNDNGLCESNEACVSTPNIGAYQGHGALSSGSIVDQGLATSVLLRSYSANGR